MRVLVAPVSVRFSEQIATGIDAGQGKPILTETHILLRRQSHVRMNKAFIAENESFLKTLKGQARK